MANNSASSGEEDEIFTSQFAALLKPIRELTKQTCWELDIAEKLDEYVHYIQDLPIEVNVNGESVKLDFAKAAMVVQNSVQIYSKKVENLWILLQDVISFLSSHKDALIEDQANPIAKLKRGHKKRTMKDNIDLLDDAPLKLRKLGIITKKKNAVQPKAVVSLPFGILQLEEAMSSFNSVKIKIFSNLKEHLGYPSDLRSNFMFDHSTLFLSINPSSCRTAGIVQNSKSGAENTVDESEVAKKNDEDDFLQPAPLEEPDVSFGENDVPFTNIDDRKSISRSNTPYENGIKSSRHPSPAPEITPSRNELKDPWKGLEPYVDDQVSNKPCGPPVHYKLPKILQKKKKEEPVNTVKKEPIIYIDQYLGTGSIKKKHLFKEYKPDDEFWEDYVHAMKTLVPLVGRKQLAKQDRTQKEESPREEVSSDDEVQGYGNNDVPFDDEWNQNDMPPQTSLGESDMEDESKHFFELVQQYMAEYTASAKGFFHSSESMKRVQAWHEMIQPRLQEAESRRDFDIHQYGTQIIEEFGSDAFLGSTCSFANLVRQKSKGEVARYFLATLQLANAYNVEILPDANFNRNRIELKLISRDRHHEQVEGFHS